ncbi:MAG: CarD family transcriptional regulator, partial [Asticcacaulis sp.]
PEQSYSERQLYESALDRMAREVAAIEKIDRDAAVAILNKSLIKAA